MLSMFEHEQCFTTAGPEKLMEDISDHNIFSLESKAASSRV